MSIEFARIIYYLLLTGQVFMPKIAYKGQKLTKLVSVNTAATITKIKPTVPVTVPVK